MELGFCPGGYRFGDSWRLGLALEILIAIVTVPILALLARRVPMAIFLSAILAVAFAASVAVAVLLAWDKRQAVRGGRRVPESTLHTLELLGGWPGSLLARRLMRHKTVKGRYRATFALCATTHVVVAALLLHRLG